MPFSYTQAKRQDLGMPKSSVRHRGNLGSCGLVARDNDVTCHDAMQVLLP
ncbi:unnamed protein product [Camellia sinensis]